MTSMKFLTLVGVIDIALAIWAAAASINLVGVPHTKPMQQFPPNFV